MDPQDLWDPLELRDWPTTSPATSVTTCRVLPSGVLEAPQVPQARLGQWGLLDHSVDWFHMQSTPTVATPDPNCKITKRLTVQGQPCLDSLVYRDLLDLQDIKESRVTAGTTPVWPSESQTTSNPMDFCEM